MYTTQAQYVTLQVYSMLCHHWVRPLRSFLEVCFWKSTPTSIKLIWRGELTFCCFCLLLAFRQDTLETMRIIIIISFKKYLFPFKKRNTVVIQLYRKSSVQYSCVFLLSLLSLISYDLIIVPTPKSNHMHVKHTILYSIVKMSTS